MSLFQWQKTRVLATVLAIAAAAQAQQLVPHAAYVYPAGGQQGTTFEVTVAGQYLDGIHDVYVSGSGVKAELVTYAKPLPPLQINQLREQLKQLREKGKNGGSTPADQKTADDIRLKLAMTLKRRAAPAFADTATLRVKITPDAAPGQRELRLAATGGLTDPLVFYVDQLPEFSKKPAAQVTIDPEELTPASRRNQQPKAAALQPPTDVALPMIVNGEIMPGGADRYRFHAHKGQRLVIAAKARALIPYISDAVPGWFQASITLYDSKGNELAHADHYGFQQDPVILYEVAEDGDYVFQIQDSIYRGREDFVYRISLGELPFVTSVFPLGGKAGARTKIELTGWNLPTTRSSQSFKDAGIHTFSLREGNWTSGPILFAADTLPETTDRQRNNSAEHAQPLKLPIVVNGRIARPDEWNVFRFEGRAGDEIVAEVFSRRLNSPLDSVLRLTDANGKQLAFNDDFDDKAAPLITHQADSRIAFKLPAKGTYYLYLSDAQHNGGPEYAYRLRVSYAQPDFELRVVPTSISVRPGLTVPLSVYALRRDGFSGDIVLRLKDAPRGFVLSGGRIPAGQDSVRVTLGAPGQNEGPQKLSLEGEAVIDGRKVRRLGVPADDMMQAFAWHHLVTSQNAFVVVSGQGRKRSDPWQLVDDKPINLPAGGTAEFRLRLPFGPFANQAMDRIHLDLDAAPEGIVLDDVSHAGDSLILRLRTEAGKIKPGLKGNLIVDVSMDIPAQTADGKPRPNARRQPLGVLPAMPFEVIER